jgi:hypothetical protein
MQEHQEQSAASPYAPPAAAFPPQADHQSVAYLSLSPGWKHKFALIEKAGGAKLPRMKELKFGERMNVMFNIWAFLFGPIYYAVKGMWRKAIAYTVLAVLASTLLDLLLELAGINPEPLSRPIGLGMAAAFATLANISYYKKVMLSDKGWI